MGERTTQYMRLDELQRAPRNAKAHSAALINASLGRWGIIEQQTIDERTGALISGHGRLDELLALRSAGAPVPDGVLVGDDGMWLAPVSRGWASVDDLDADAAAIALNRIGEVGGWESNLSGILDELATNGSLEAVGYSREDFDRLVNEAAAAAAGPAAAPFVGPSLADRFLVPPFSVFDARQGYWQERKRRWLALGIRSEEGRAHNLLKMSDSVLEAQGGRRLPNGSTPASHSGNDPAYYWKKQEAERQHGGPLTNEEFEASWYTADAYVGGTSIFDPVLCEIAYRWWTPAGGRVLDPFAGGSVRGVVAALLGRSYVGVDLSALQAETNRAQWEALAGSQDQQPASASEPTADPLAVTPIEGGPEGWVKRDDLFGLPGGWGGKVRSCQTLVDASMPVAGLCTAGSRHSPQAAIVAGVAARAGVPCRIHHPAGEITPELRAAEALGAELVGHRPGYNGVIIARSREDAAERGWLDVPFGMETPAAVEATAAQAANVPAEVRRIVVPVGSGMSAAGIVAGLRAAGRDVPVLGVVVGADPRDRLTRFCPGWEEQLELVDAQVPYQTAIDGASWLGAPLDPHYEAKCLPFLQPGDLLWIVGRRVSAARPAAAAPAPSWLVGDSLAVLPELPADQPFDMVFSCPPYFDLEQYSDDPADLSNAGDYEAFLKAYREIIRLAVERLAPDRFACFVVGDIRAPDGAYRGFVADTVAAFEDAGCSFHNDIVLVTAVGSLALRAARIFGGARRVGKAHQNVLVFCKGDPKRAAAACAPVDAADLAQLFGELLIEEEQEAAADLLPTAAG